MEILRLINKGEKMLRKILLIMAFIIGLGSFAFATTNNGINSSYTNNSDGWQMGGGTTSRLFTITGSAWTLGTNSIQDATGTFTMPGGTDTLAGISTAQTWGALQKYTKSDFTLLGTSTGYTILNSGLASSSNNTLTLPTTSSDTLAALGTAQNFTAQQNFTGLVGVGFSGVPGYAFDVQGTLRIIGPSATTAALLIPTGNVGINQASPGQLLDVNGTIKSIGHSFYGSSTGVQSVVSANSSSTNYTMTIPAATDTFADLAGTQTFTNKTLTSTTDVLGGVTLTLGSDATADVYYRNSSGYLTRLGQPGANEVLGYDSTDAIPAYMVLGSGITYTHSTHTISVSGSGFSPPSTTVITGTTQNAATNNVYITNNASLVTITAPTTCAVGDWLEIEGLGAGGWKLAQNASQNIHMGSSVTTTGTSGYLSSNNAYDSISMTCAVANTTWLVDASQGNITVN